MRARLYGMSISHPANTARLMLEHKGIAYDLVDLPPGSQAVVVRAAGFRGGTVPAIKLDGRKVLGTTAISRLLDEVCPEPPLFPSDPGRRRAVEEAEAWGEAVLQPVPRRLLRWALATRPDARREFTELLGLPLPGVMAAAMRPVAALYARRENARSLEQIRADQAAIAGHLDRVDALIADGVIGGAQRNAADFQIGTTLRVLLVIQEFAGLLDGRPAADLGRSVWPDFPFAAAPQLLPGEISELPHGG